MHLPSLLAFLNAVVAVSVFAGYMVGARYPWPGNAPLLLWVMLSIVAWAFASDDEGAAR